MYSSYFVLLTYLPFIVTSIEFKVTCEHILRNHSDVCSQCISYLSVLSTLYPRLFLFLEQIFVVLLKTALRHFLPYITNMASAFYVIVRNCHVYFPIEMENLLFVTLAV